MFQTWLILGGCLAILQYVGFSLSSGSGVGKLQQHVWGHIESKPDQSNDNLKGVWVVSKLLDLSLNFVFYLMCSWGLAFGGKAGDASTSGGMSSSMFAGSSQFFVHDVSSSAGGFSIVFFTFAVTSLSMVIVAEKVRHQLVPLHFPYHFFMTVSGAVVCPIVVHWAWSDSGWASPWRSYDPQLLLSECGVLDTGGSSTIHITAALIALGFSAAMVTKSEFRLVSYAQFAAGEVAEDAQGEIQDVLLSTSPTAMHGNGEDNSSGNSNSNDAEAQGQAPSAAAIILAAEDAAARGSSSGNSNGGGTLFAAPGARRSHSSSKSHSRAEKDQEQIVTRRMRLLHEQEKRTLEGQRWNAHVKQAAGLLLVWVGSYGTSIACNLPGLSDTDGDSDTLVLTPSTASIGRRVINITMAGACACLASVAMNSAGWLTMRPAHEAVRERHLEHVRMRRRRRSKGSQTPQNQNQRQSSSSSSSNSSNSHQKNDAGLGDVDALQPLLQLSYRHFQQFEEEGMTTSSHIGSVICALVAIKAGCSVVELEGAAVIGFLAAPMHRLFWLLQVNCIQQSSREGAFHVHLAGGVWGMIATGLFASPEGYRETVTDIVPLPATPAGGTSTLVYRDRSEHCSGVFYGGSGGTLAANIIFMLALLVWCFSLMYVHPPATLSLSAPKSLCLPRTLTNHPSLCYRYSLYSLYSRYSLC